jgi:hypothetical protein
MRKSTVIAKCLVNSRMINSLEEAEHAVQRVFGEEFPQRNFEQWNLVVQDEYGAQIIRNVGRATTINVKSFIEDLSEHTVPITPKTSDTE